MIAVDRPNSSPTNAWVLLTGAAGGIGSAIAESLLGCGFGVLGIDTQSSVADLFDNERFKGVVADTRSLDELKVAVAQAPGPIHHVATFAGIALPAESRDDAGRGLPDVDVFRQSVDLNLTGHYAALLAAKPSLDAEHGNRSVTFCSSINALQGYGLVGYSAAKAGLVGLMHALLVPLGRKGIRVNVIAPGTIPTKATRAEWAHVPDHFDRLTASSPIGRLGSPSDVAAGVVALIRDLTHVSGQTLVIDGGESVGR